jgi:type VI secretion system protein ImpD/type VI secretion system protein ImpC
MTAGYAFAAVVLRAFANHAWPADVRGSETDREGGGVVTHLPVESFSTDPPHVWVRAAPDLVLTDRQERGLVDLGLMPLSALPYGEEAVFGAVRSLQAPAPFAGPNAAAANANARISAQLNSMLCASRFAHYLKHLGREMVGSFRTADEIERALQSWVQSYVNANTMGAADMRSRFPLVAARVTVRERPGRPGVFACTILLQPHFQLDDVSAQFRLITDIAAPGAR